MQSFLSQIVKIADIIISYVANYSTNRPHTFSSQNLDDKGGICLGKISSTTLSGEKVSHFKPQDLQNIRLEIRIDKV